MNPASIEPADISGVHTPYYEQLYKQLNPQGMPEVNASLAAQFLKASNIDVVYLSQIWELADYRRAGSLDKRGAYIAFKLVATVQQGLPLQAPVITAQLAQPPQFNIAGQPPPTSFQRSNSVLAKSPSILSGGGPVSPTLVEWDIDLTEQQKYDAIFQSLNPVNGRLSGEAVRPVLLNSQLPHTHLAKIWELSDIDKDGQLDRYEMYVALHLVYKCLQNAELPDRLPLSLVHPAKRNMLGAGGIGVPPMGSNQPMPPPSRRTSWASTGAGVQNPRMALNLNSRTSSIISLNNSGVPDPPSKPATPIGALTPGFKSIFEDKDPPSWPIDTSKYEADFRRIDTDYDGLVSGVDAKQLLMSCGLPQHVLAQIWALVDIAHAGRINLEQFSLVLELTNECRHGIRLPEILPAFLVPPSTISRTMGVSNSSASLTNNSTPVATALPSSNPRIIELNEEIEKVMDNRRQAEQDLFQLEADTTVKNSEIKNLEIELLTLSATVKQLQHQKGEANKRLAEMDDKIGKLEGVCTEQSERLEAEKDRLDKVKLEISQANENFTAEEEILQSLREEELKIDEKCGQVKRTLDEENSKIEHLVDQLTMMERRTDANEKETSRVDKLTTELSELLQKLEKDSDNKDENSRQLDYGEELRHNFQKIILSAEGVVSPVSARPSKQFDSADPFKAISGSVDPFEDSVDPFGASSTARGSLIGPADPFSATGTKSGSAGEFADFSKFASFGTT